MVLGCMHVHLSLHVYVHTCIHYIYMDIEYIQICLYCMYIYIYTLDKKRGVNDYHGAAGLELALRASIAKYQGHPMYL